MARQIIRDGLITYWDGVNNSSESTHSKSTLFWYDLSGHGNHGRLSNLGPNYGEWTNNSLNTTDYNLATEVWSTLTGKDTYNLPWFTLEMTFKINPNPKSGDSYQHIYYFGKKDGRYTNRGRVLHKIYYSYSKKTIEIFFSTIEGDTDNNHFITIDVSNFFGEVITLTATVKTNIAYVYLNGILYDAMVVDSFAMNKTDTDNYYFTWGAMEDYTHEYPTEYYSFRMYNRPLSDNEVYYNYIANMSHLFPEETPTYPEIPIIRPDGSIIEPVEDGYVSRVAIGNEELYNIKDTKARTTKLDKYKDEEVYGLVSFINGIQIDIASIRYDQANNTVVFK